MDRISDHFKHRKNAPMARQTFLKAKPSAGETISNFITSLQKLTENCDYEAGRDNQNPRQTLRMELVTYFSGSSKPMQEKTQIVRIAVETGQYEAATKDHGPGKRINREENTRQEEESYRLKSVLAFQDKLLFESQIAVTDIYEHTVFGYIQPLFRGKKS
ncbi:hypothetical protein P5673_030049 [Acropora cervicornis]|uniref:Uncharacterized protein n=1 Tax=Acropora cervicornis TaxID=6130 RepID=A0AAD9PVN0_ACRCE|nr:hypothetical protein P5673_030049 [Acropora cervicornis]